LSLKFTETTHRIPQKVLTTSRIVDECKPLDGGGGGGGASQHRAPSAPASPRTSPTPPKGPRLVSGASGGSARSNRSNSGGMDWEEGPDDGAPGAFGQPGLRASASPRTPEVDVPGTNPTAAAGYVTQTDDDATPAVHPGRGLHSSTSRINLSRF